MTDELESDAGSLPLPALERIDRACLEFEAAWKKARAAALDAAGMSVPFRD